MLFIEKEETARKRKKPATLTAKKPTKAQPKNTKPAKKTKTTKKSTKSGKKLRENFIKSPSNTIYE